MGHGVDGAGFGNGLVHANATNATNTNTYNASKLINESKVNHGVDGAGFGNGLSKTSANVTNATSSVQARARNPNDVGNLTVNGSTAVENWKEDRAARLEAAAEAAWVKKETENAEVKAKYEAFKEGIAKTMKLENEWKNGTMSSGTDLPADGT
jgi:hypothetical protein